jgi:hypothetical protein
LWSSIVADYDLDEHELALLTQAVRTVDLLERLHELVIGNPVMDGDKPHAAVVEARQQRITLARLLAALRVPMGEQDEDAPPRTQRRVGVRGVYGGRA